MVHELCSSRYQVLEHRFRSYEPVSMCDHSVRLEACLHIPIPSPLSFIIVAMVMACLTGGMGLEPILPVRQLVTIGTMMSL